MMTLGEMLIDARKKAGYSALDVARATRIMVSAIQFMEDDQLDSLPAAGYVRGYILSYCRYVGCNPQPLLEQYQRQTGHARHGHDSMGIAPIDRSAERLRGGHQDMPWKVVIVVAAAIVLLGSIIWFAAGLLKPKDTTTPPLPNAPQGSTVTSTTTDATQGTGDGNTATPGEAFDFTVKAKSGKASKITIIVDDAEAYEGSLTGDEDKSYERVFEAKLEIKKPNNVVVTQNGTNIPIPADGVLTLRAARDDN
jgi:cytoskeletal protein RodZ